MKQKRIIETGLLSGEVPYQLRRSYQAKRLQLKLLPTIIDVVVPRHVSLKRAYDFLYHSASWINQHAQYLIRQNDHKQTNLYLPSLNHVINLQECPCERHHNCYHLDECSLHALQESLSLSVKKICLKSALVLLMRAQISQLLLDIGFYDKRIKFRFGWYRSIWGSCASDAITLNTKLSFYHEDTLRYVLCHELCHLQHQNHSPDFWAAVSRIFPEYLKQEALLKQPEINTIPYWLL